MRHAIDLSLSTRMWASPVASPIDSLFEGGKQGVWFDPSDFGAGGTLYKDTIGTDPVTAAGDTIALRMDKHSWGGKTLNQVIASQPELKSIGTISTSGTPPATLATYDTVTGAGTLFRDAAGTSGVTFLIGGATYIDIENTGLAGLTLRAGSISGTVLVTLLSGQRATYYLAGVIGTFALSMSSSANTSFVVHSVKLIPGNHAVQATAASRMVLQRRPAGGRRNLLTYSEQFNNAAWTRTHVFSSAPTVTTDGAADPNGVLQADVVAFPAVTGSQGSLIYQSITPPAAGNYTGSVYLRANASGDVGKTLYVYMNAVSGAGEQDRQTVVLTADYQRIDSTGSMTAGANQRFTVAALGSGFSGVDQAAVNVDMAWGQYEAGTAPTAYQKVVSTHDVTEAGKRDTWWFGLDGSDDGDATPSIDFSGGDKVTTFVSAHKTVNSTQILVEFSASLSGNSGSFYLATEPAAGRAWSAASRGTAIASANHAAFESTAAPDTAVITATHDIAGDLSTIRRSGVAGTSGTGDKGAGNFGNYPLYTGRRGGTALAFPGRIGDQIVVAGIPSAAQISAVKQRLMYKAGLV